MGDPDPSRQRDRRTAPALVRRARRGRPRRLDPPLAGAARTRAGLGPARHRAEDRLPHRRQPGAAAARRGRARARLHRAAGRPARGGLVPDLAVAGRSPQPPRDRPLLPAAAADDGDLTRAHRRHPQAGRPLTSSPPAAASPARHGTATVRLLRAMTMPSEEDHMPDLAAMLQRGPVVCAEGYLFECERRGYLQAGAFVPEVVLDHPEVVEELHREFVHAGSDVVEAFTYYGHRQKLRVIGKED